MTDEQLRIRGYLQAQGAKLSPAELADKVRVAMGRVRESAMGVAAARFTTSTTPGRSRRSRPRS